MITFHCWHCFADALPTMKVIAVTTEALARRDVPVDATDVRVAITKITNEMPSPEVTERVKQRLAAVGWPVTDAFGSSD